MPFVLDSFVALHSVMCYFLSHPMNWHNYLRRFSDLKQCQKILVGVRIQSTKEWMEVGRVRSENDKFTEVAIARQRALIAEVCIELFSSTLLRFHNFVFFYH